MLIAGCGEKKQPSLPRAAPSQTRELTLRLDSAAMLRRFDELGLKRHLAAQVETFYRERGYAGAWVTRRGVNEFAGNFLNLLNNEYRGAEKDSAIDRGRMLAYYEEMYSSEGQPDIQHAAELELLLSVNFFRYAERTWGGAHDTVLRRAHWFISRKKMEYPALLDEFLSSGKPVVPRIPVYEQYNLLKEWLRKYARLEENNAWPQINDSIPVLKRGDSATIVRDIRKLLYYLEDIDEDNGSARFDSSFAAAVKRFQHRHGLNDAGVIGPETAKWLRTPLRAHIEKILINMERCRWVPLDIRGDYLMVNIPEFRLYVYSESQLSWTCRTIVGKSDPIFKTIIFNDSMEFVVFNPYWNVPKNIFLKETLPALQKDAGYLAKNNFEVVDRKGNVINPSTLNWKKYTDNFPYIVRERQGPNNSLGKVKFLFPNAYDIYLHDTPAKTLFESSSRAFSHGCIRVQEPFRLARYVLRSDSQWTQEKIDKTLATNKETFVKLRKKIPVFISYFTAWVDREGRLNFRDDVYGHDGELGQMLFGG